MEPLHTISPRDPSDDYIYGPSGVPIEQVSQSTGAATYFYTDQLGSVVMETNQSGAVTGTQEYSAYGTLASSTGTDASPFGFAGGYTDVTGLIYLVNRYYDPGTGQFLSVDPLVAETHASYSYALDNPANWSDPMGLAIYNECTGMSGMSEATCDVKQYIAQSFASDISCTICAAVVNILLGAIAGAVSGGPLGVATSIIGAVGAAAFTVVEAYQFISNSYIDEVVHSVYNIMYADLTTVSVACGQKTITNPTSQDIYGSTLYQTTINAINVFIAFYNNATYVAQFFGVKQLNPVGAT